MAFDDMTAAQQAAPANPLAAMAMAAATDHLGVDLLLEMARRQELDPWNLNLSDLAEKYLAAMRHDATAERQLKHSGQVILTLAVLLRLKSDQLAGHNWNAEEEILPEEAPLEEGLGLPVAASATLPQGVRLATNVVSLEDALRRRTSTKQPRIRPVTLTELISEIKRVEALEAERQLLDAAETRAKRRGTARDYAQLSADDIEAMAHEEFVEDGIARLTERLETLFKERPWVSFAELVETGARYNLDRVAVFLSLLFMDARGELTMTQAEAGNFYSPIRVFAHEAEGLSDVTADEDTLAEFAPEPRQRKAAEGGAA